MNARQTDTLLSCFCINIYPTMFCNRQIILRSLKVLWEIWIVVILAVKFTIAVDGAVRSKTCLDGIVHHLTIKDGQNAGQSEADRAYMCILICAESRRTAAENLGLCLELTVNLKTDDGFVFHALPPIDASFIWKSCPCS